MKRFATLKAHLISMLFLSVSLLASGSYAADSMRVDLGAASGLAASSTSEFSTPSNANTGDLGVNLIAANDITEFNLVDEHSISTESEKVNADDNGNESCPLSKKNNACRTEQ